MMRELPQRLVVTPDRQECTNEHDQASKGLQFPRAYKGNEPPSQCRQFGGVLLLLSDEPVTVQLATLAEPSITLVYTSKPELPFQ